MRKFILPVVCLILAACGGEKKENNETAKSENTITEKTRIVSLNGTLTEIICAAGFEKNIVGVDVTSTYPESMQKVAKTGHNRTVAAEGVLSLNPDIIIGREEDVQPEVLQQLQSSGKKIWLFKQEYTPEGTVALITAVTDSLGVPEKGKTISDDVTKKMEAAGTDSVNLSVLFIYARGAGTLMVSGTGTQMDKMIQLAGACNAMTGFEEFKPLTPEALVTANPDVILLFTSGMESLEGEKGLLAVPGISATKAAKNNAFITMDGQYLTGFGPRLGDAVSELKTKLKAFAVSE